MPHSDFLAWLSSATFKYFISDVLTRILMLYKANLVYSLKRLRRQPQIKDEMELHIINIIYAASLMCEQTEKTTFLCKDLTIVEWGARAYSTLVVLVSKYPFIDIRVFQVHCENVGAYYSG